MNDEKQKRKLVDRLREYMIKSLEETIPEKGIFKPHSAYMTWPGTNFIARTMIEFKSSTPGLTGRVLRVGMHRNGSDRMVSHYLIDGSNIDLIYWLKSSNSAQELIKEFDSLQKSVEDLDE